VSGLEDPDWKQYTAGKVEVIPHSVSGNGCSSRTRKDSEVIMGTHSVSRKDCTSSTTIKT